MSAMFSTLTDGQLELTSTHTCDAEESAWSVMNLGLIDGWNELELDFTTPDGFHRRHP